MDTGTRTGIAYLSDDASDAVTAYRTSIRNLAAWAETQGALYAQGLLSARPAAGKAGRLYRATDDVTGVIYYDDGTAWQSIGGAAAVDAAANVGSLRTLGAGALQAAAGTHTHAIGAITGAGTAAAAALGAANGAASLDSSGQVPASQLGNAAVVPLYVYKAADSSRSSTTSLTSDPHLNLTLTVGSWLVDADLSVSGNTGGDFLACLNFSGTATVRFGPAWQGANVSVTDYAGTSLNVYVTALNSSTAFGTMSGNGYVRARAVLVVTASGSLTVDWAQNAANAASTTVRTGSHLVATKLA